MSNFNTELSTISDVIDQFAETSGVGWIKELSPVEQPDTTEILAIHRTAPDEDNFLVREYLRRQGVPHKRARFSERKWDAMAKDATSNNQSRRVVHRVIPGLKFDQSTEGFDRFDIVWISRRVGRLVESKMQKEFELTKAMMESDGEA